MVYSIGAETFEVDATFHNGFASDSTGTVNLVIHNAAGQTVGLDATTGMIRAGQNGTFHPTVHTSLPPGTYTVLVFATDSTGAAISNPAEGSFKQPYYLAVQSISEGGNGPVIVSVGFINLSTKTVNGTLWVYAKDSYGNVFSTTSLNITVPGNSTFTTPEITMPGTQRLSLCFLQFTFVVLAPNGTKLSPSDHEIGPDCPAFGFPITSPTQMTLGSLRALAMNVTNITPFPVTLVIFGEVKTGTGTPIEISSLSLTLEGGEISTGYLAILGLPCGDYAVHISDQWIAPSPPPPFTPQFISNSFDTALKVC